VVLFFGTPRRHKGLLAVGAAVAALPAELQPVFLVAGAFPAGDPALEQELRTLVPATRLQLLGNQPVEQMGLTVLVSEVAPLREMVERGWVVAVEPERLTEQLARWMGDLEGLAEQGAQALVGFQEGLVLAIVAQQLGRGVQMAMEFPRGFGLNELRLLRALGWQ